MTRLAELGPDHFVTRLRERGHRRAWLAPDPASGGWRGVPDVGAELAVEAAGLLAEVCEGTRPHAAVFLEVGRESGALFGAFVHSTVRGQAQGGLRRWPYPRVQDFLRDGLRLSLAMTRKNALAGLWWGGGKGLIAECRGAAAEGEARRALYREYGAFVSGLRGCYVTAEDVGTSPADVAEVFSRTRFTTCIPPECGGSGNPSRTTATGVLHAMEAALESRGEGPLAGRVVAVQGAGNVGAALIELLAGRGARVVASEISAARRAALTGALPDGAVELRPASGSDELLAEPCDVLAPCALGGVLDARTLPRVRARIVCGAANNPLADEIGGARALAEREILYVPDFVANRMGIVACADEQYGALEGDPHVARHLDRACPDGIYQTVLRILEIAREEGATPLETAHRLADERAREPHPIWDRRAEAIVASLLAGAWVKGP